MKKDEYEVKNSKTGQEYLKKINFCHFEVSRRKMKLKQTDDADDEFERDENSHFNLEIFMVE